MPRKPLLVLVPILLAGVGGAAFQKVARDRQDDRSIAAARAVLGAQAEAWNRGDVLEYMQGYANEDSTTFVSGDTIMRGWQRVLERYRTRYGTREKMGTLVFSELEFRPLGESYLLAAGRWQLTRAADTPHGRFTLIFHRTDGGWRIVHDHTSSAE